MACEFPVAVRQAVANRYTLFTLLYLLTCMLLSDTGSRIIEGCVGLIHLKVKQDRESAHSSYYRAAAAHKTWTLLYE